MSATLIAPSVTARVAAKARRLVEEGRMHAIEATSRRSWLGLADGDGGRYLVALVAGEAMPEVDGARVPARGHCDCKRWEDGRICSHIAAAHLLMFEHVNVPNREGR